MSRILLAFTTLGALVTAASGCGPGGGGSRAVVDELRVGGSVAYCRTPGSVLLPGVAVTLSSFEGETATAVTSSGGVWEIDDVPEGIYTLSYALTGYEPWSAPLIVSQPPGTPSVLVDAGTTCMEETLATVAIAPFGATLVNGEFLVDGTGGQTFVFSKGANAAVVLTFDRPLPTAGTSSDTPSIKDSSSSQTVFSTADATHTVFTFSDVVLDSFNAGGGLTTNGFLHYLEIPESAQFDPISGQAHPFEATIRFRATP